MSIIDRWFYFSMAVFYFLTVVVGFAPTSYTLITAVQAGQRPPPPLALHLHAVTMGSWMLLLVMQAWLAGSGRIGIHRRLGMIAFVIAPAVALAMVLNVRSTWMQIASIPPGALDPVVLVNAKTTTANILLEQFRSAILFSVFATWALAVRRTDLETHKRMIILATLMPLSAGIDRIADRWLPNNFPEGYESEFLYVFLWLTPALIYDLVRRGRVHRAYVIGLLCNVPFVINTLSLWGSPQWRSLAPAIMGVRNW